MHITVNAMENERNKETLRTAIARLPLYTPPGSVWDQVHARINGAAEASLLDTAPQFRAPASAWDKIDEALDYQASEKNRDQLRRALALLPVYPAPGRVWRGLRDALEEGTARVRSLPQWRHAFGKIAAVAAVLLLFGASWWANVRYDNRLVIKSEQKNMQSIQLDEVEIIVLHPESSPDSIDLEAGTEITPGLGPEASPEIQ